MALHRSIVGQIVTVAWPGGAVALTLSLASSAPSVSGSTRVVLLALAILALVYGVVIARRVRVRADNEGLVISNGLQTHHVGWNEIRDLHVEKIRVLANGGLYGLVVHDVSGKRLVLRASLMMSNKDKQRLLDVLNDRLAARDVGARLPRTAKTFWIGPRGRQRAVS